MRSAIILVGASAFLSSTNVAAQLAAAPAEEMSEKLDATKDPDKPVKGHQILIVPIPQLSPTLGSGLTLVGALFYNPKHEPEPWITGGGYMRTSNGSSMIALAHKMSLGHDRFRLLAVGGSGTFNMKFYGIGADAGSRDRYIELTEKGIVVAGQAEYRLAPHFYSGILAGPILRSGDRS